MHFFSEGDPDREITAEQAGALLDRLLGELGALKRVLIVPPDITRLHSGAGELTCMLYQRLKGGAHVEILPAIGTHFPVSAAELDRMYPGIPHDRFFTHDWRYSLHPLGEAPAEFIRAISNGRVEYPIRCEIDRKLVRENWDCILSVGQLVPHEVVGIANHNKNIFVGVGGQDTINRTHFLGAVCNMEACMGRLDSPVRQVFDYMSEHFAAGLPVVYLLTVRGLNEAGELVTRGLYAGTDKQCYLDGARLCQQVNLDLLEQPLEKVVVQLDALEFKSTWIGNKSVYRTRMALADGGELIVLAPGLREFGEDREIDRLIRKYGYRGTAATLAAVEANAELRNNLSAAAHLIHGSSEGRFKITYCPGKLSEREIRAAGYDYAPLDAMQRRYPREKLRTGFNTLPDGEEIFYIDNPALGLWGLRSQFEDAPRAGVAAPA